MSTVRYMVLAGALFALAACGSQGLPDSKPEARSSEAPGGGLFANLFRSDRDAPSDDTRQTRPRLPAPLSRASMAGGDIVVAGPSGYCVDPTTLQNRLGRGFALIASCHILSGGRLGDPVATMLVSVTVGPHGTADDLPTPSEIASASGVSLLGGETSDGFVAAHLASGGDGALPGGDDRYWRGAFLQGDRLIGLALYAPKGSALSGSTGGAMLARVKTRIATLSGGGAAPKAPAQAQPRETGFLGRLFNR